MTANEYRIWGDCDKNVLKFMVVVVGPQLYVKNNLLRALFFYFFEMEPCSAARAGVQWRDLTATSVSRVQAILWTQPPKWDYRHTNTLTSQFLCIFSRAGASPLWPDWS